MIAYKIVWERVSSFEFCSAFVPPNVERFFTTYKIGEPAFPPEGTALFAFDTKVHAIKYASRMGWTLMGILSPNEHRVLFRCEVEKASFKIHRIPKDVCYAQLSEFWTNTIRHRRARIGFGTDPMFAGTILCSSITLLERIV